MCLNPKFKWGYLELKKLVVNKIEGNRRFKKKNNWKWRNYFRPKVKMLRLTGTNKHNWLLAKRALKITSNFTVKTRWSGTVETKILNNGIQPIRRKRTRLPKTLIRTKDCLADFWNWKTEQSHQDEGWYNRSGELNY